VVATSDVTRGARGNLGSTAIDSVADSARNRALFEPLLTASPFRRVGNPWPATGGTVAETIREAIARAREEREAPLRAVTLADHVALAIATPGARIARAEARANFHPGFPCLVAPGIVTVLVLPSLPLGRPEPTDGLRQLVAAWLHEHRVIGSRIEVAGPVYVPVSVRATVGAQENVNAADLAAVISERIDQFLDPLLGGPDGTGWPFGRDVYRSEILQLIDETPGVEHVRALELIDGAGNASCGNFCLGPLGLPDGQAHQIEIVPRSQQ
jgi:predicted phage baseplate assembly protein